MKQTPVTIYRHLLRRLDDRQRNAVLSFEDDCDLCKPEAEAYWQASFGDNWQKWRDEYCEALQCPIGL